MARPDFRSAAARRLSEDRELPTGVLSLLGREGEKKLPGVRQIPVDRIDPNPQQPRLMIDEVGLNELAASLREHGVLQPILVRPAAAGRFQLVAGERRWRAAQLAGLTTVPGLVEELDDDTALEIAIIENLQREDLSPLDEASMYDRMTREHGYSIRKLAQKIGKDKGYIENRLRLADAPPEVRELVSLRKDTVSHAYELLKVEDPRKRRRLAEQVARGELSLMKLRQRIEGRRAGSTVDPEMTTGPGGRATIPTAAGEAAEAADQASAAREDASPDGVPDSMGLLAGHSDERGPRVLGDDALVQAKTRLGEALDELVDVLRGSNAMHEASETDRANLAKYLTIAKLRLENAIVVLRAGQGADPGRR